MTVAVPMVVIVTAVSRFASLLCELVIVTNDLIDVLCTLLVNIVSVNLNIFFAFEYQLSVVHALARIHVVDDHFRHAFLLLLFGKPQLVFHVVPVVLRQLIAKPIVDSFIIPLEHVSIAVPQNGAVVDLFASYPFTLQICALNCANFNLGSFVWVRQTGCCGSR
jgi:hypothetical protein